MKAKSKYMRDGRAPIPEKEITSKIMSAIKGKDTKPEVQLRKYFWAQGIRGYRINWRKAKGCPDICWPRRKIAVFVHGCFWHRCPYCKLPLPKAHTKYWKEKFKKNKERDKKNKKQLLKKRWRIFIVWECKIKENLKREADKIIKQVKPLLNKKTTQKLKR